MLVFLLTSVPIAFVTFLLILEGQSLPSRVTVFPFIKGAISYFVVYLVMLIFDPAFPLYFNPGQIFLYYAAKEFVLPIAIITVCFFIFNVSVWKDSRLEGLVGMIGFLAGYFTVRALSDFFTQHTYYGPYYLFMLPLARVGLLALIPSATAAFRAEHSWVRWAYLAIAIVAVPAFATVPMLHTLEFEAQAILTSIALFLVALGASYAVVRVYVPVRV